MSFDRLRFGQHSVNAGAGKHPFVICTFLAGGLLCGCLSRPSLSRQFFTFSTPATTPGIPNTNSPLLSIRQVSVAAPFAGQSFVYRTGEFSYEQDPYAQFLAPPEEAIAEPVRTYLSNSGKFRIVIEPGSALQPNLLLEISVSELYGDFRNPASPAAVLGMSFIFEAVKGLPGKLVWQRQYQQRIPLKGRTAAALMAGWNQALQRILAEAANSSSGRQTSDRADKRQ